MKRMAKPPGRGNVVLEDAPIPEPGYGEVRVKAVRSLISRGSEIGRRYVMDEAIDPQMMGYSMAGVVDAPGDVRPSTWTVHSPSLPLLKI